MHVKRIMVVGAGTMGAGIAQVCAESGYDVTLYDTDLARLEQALADIARFIRRGAEKGRRTQEEAEHAIARVEACADLAEGARERDLVVEAIVENMDAKRALFAALAAACPERTIVASNTSSLSVSEMATAYRPELFVGAHFFNPAPVMRLVELIVGGETSPTTVETAAAFLRSLGKTPVIVRDSPNFIVNRISRPLYYEGQLLAMEGVLPQDVDAAARGAGLRMGPLELLDMSGLDPHLASSETALREWGDPKWRPIPIVRTLVRAGHLGRKAGRGFYLYPDGEQVPRLPSPTYDATPSELRTVVVLGAGESADALAGAFAAAGIQTAVGVDAEAPPPELGRADLVVEAIEGLERAAALALFERLGRVAGPTTLLATSSTFLSPSELGVASGRPERTIALHVPLPSLERRFLEVGKGLDTDDGTIATALALAERIGWSAVVVAETPAYLVYRLLAPMMNEAATALYEGLASAEDIDTAMRLALNHPFGPLEWADRIGVDRVLRTMEFLQAETGDPRYRPVMLLRQMVRAGRLGRKSGQGFFRYDDSTAAADVAPSPAGAAA